MKRLVVVLASMVLFTGTAYAAEPWPDNPDGTRGKIGWSYTYVVASKQYGGILLRCNVSPIGPVRWPRWCWIIGY